MLARTLVFVLIVMLGVGGALELISERAALTRRGYRIARLEREQRRLVESNRGLAVRVARLKCSAQIIERARELKLEVVPPEERLKEEYQGASEAR